jgi:hypothetical protein
VSISIINCGFAPRYEAYAANPRLIRDPHRAIAETPRTTIVVIAIGRGGGGSPRVGR